MNPKTIALICFSIYATTTLASSAPTETTPLVGEETDVQVTDTTLTRSEAAPSPKRFFNFGLFGSRKKSESERVEGLPLVSAVEKPERDKAPLKRDKYADVAPEVFDAVHAVNMELLKNGPGQGQPKEQIDFYWIYHLALNSDFDEIYEQGLDKLLKKVVEKYGKSEEKTANIYSTRFDIQKYGAFKAYNEIKNGGHNHSYKIMRAFYIRQHELLERYQEFLTGIYSNLNTIEFVLQKFAQYEAARLGVIPDEQEEPQAKVASEISEPTTSESSEEA